MGQIAAEGRGLGKSGSRRSVLLGAPRRCQTQTLARPRKVLSAENWQQARSRHFSGHRHHQRTGCLWCSSTSRRGGGGGDGKNFFPPPPKKNPLDWRKDPSAGPLHLALLEKAKGADTLGAVRGFRGGLNGCHPRQHGTGGAPHRSRRMSHLPSTFNAFDENPRAAYQRDSTSSVRSRSLRHACALTRNKIHPFLDRQTLEDCAICSRRPSGIAPRRGCSARRGIHQALTSDRSTRYGGTAPSGNC